MNSVPHSLFVHITESIPKRAGDRGAARPTSPSNAAFKCRIRGLDVENIEGGILGLGAVDPYYAVSKKVSYPSTGGTRWVRVYRSEYVPNHVNPYWDEFCLDLETLSNGDDGEDEVVAASSNRGRSAASPSSSGSGSATELKIDLYDHQHGGLPDRWLGCCRTTVGGLRLAVTRGGNASREDALQVMGLEKDGVTEREVGLVVVLKAEVVGR